MGATGTTLVQEGTCALGARGFSRIQPSFRYYPLDK